MGLPFEPEPLAALQARYATVLTTTFDTAVLEEWVAGGRPGLFRRYVFDFEDGVRFIISRERMPTKQTALHLSISIMAGSPFEVLVLARPEGQIVRFTTQQLQRRWQALAGSPQLPVLLGVTPGSVFHFLVWDS